MCKQAVLLPVDDNLQEEKTMQGKQERDKCRKSRPAVLWSVSSSAACARSDEMLTTSRHSLASLKTTASSCGFAAFSLMGLLSN